ncbi:hypothetical protein [Flavobacterium sp. UBA7680]|uniref:hypothetical protein n=1 Tax=Flavobacterium sp. UBA7680 TaxID=1946559 RepID=UPI0025BF520C|nr:hypothetical protein [Flavobacterium sp. UBA7680]
MSKFPLDIVNFNEDLDYELETAITIANAIQHDFIFHKSDQTITQKFKLIHYDNNDGNEFLNDSFEVKNSLSGYFPYMLFVSGNPLEADGWGNLFAHTHSENGVSIITTNNVPDLIIPREKIEAYFVYYFARTLMKLLFIGKYNHDIPSEKGCLFDFMQQKIDILKSMRANAICDHCRREIRKYEKKMSESQFQSIDRLLSKAGAIVRRRAKNIY